MHPHVGILLGEALFLLIGRGAWQVSLIVLIAIMLAVFVGGSAPLITQAATSAFRRATVGQIANFTVVKSNRLTANEIFAVHPSALVLANVAPENPQGAVYSSRRSYRGYGLRVLRDYDPNFLRDRSVISTFTGISSVNDEYQTDANGLVLDVNGDPTLTNKNVRGARGTFVP